MGDLVWILISALLVNNFTLTLFLGLCSFFGVTSKIGTAVRLGLANVFVLVLTALCAWFLNRFVLGETPYLRLIAFIVVIASVVQVVEMAIKKWSPALFTALGIYLPLITTNCQILALALFQTSREYNFMEGIFFALGAGGGFTLTLVLMAGLREENDLATIPQVLKGAAMSFLMAGILSMAFMGFAGLFSSTS
jgi:electron transport complex protein RnfA